MQYKNTPLYRHLTKTIAQQALLPDGLRLLGGVSGGPDSTAMIHLLCALAPMKGWQVGVAHFHHGLRGQSADGDARFVAQLAGRLGCPFHTRKAAPALQTGPKFSPEEAAREARYAFLEQAADGDGYQRIVLGHQADDNAEQVLMAMLRGSGPAGLAGIPVRRGDRVVRPLLTVRREELREFLIENNLDYRTDESNSDVRFLRNRVRHQLLPLLAEAFNPNIVSVLIRTAAICGDEERYLDREARTAYAATVVQRSKHRIAFSVERLRSYDVVLCRRVLRVAILNLAGSLRRIGFEHIEAVLALMGPLKQGRHLDLPHQVRAGRDGDRLVIQKERLPLRQLGRIAVR